MAAIRIEYANPALGPIKIKGEGNPSEPAPLVDVNLSGESKVKMELATPAGQPPFAVETIVNGNSLNPIGVALTTPTGEAIAATVGATIHGGTPVTAVVNGGATPLTAAVTATVAAPVRVEVGVSDIGFRNATVRFKLFGLLTILTMEVGP